MGEGEARMNPTIDEMRIERDSALAYVRSTDDRLVRIVEQRNTALDMLHTIEIERDRLIEALKEIAEDELDYGDSSYEEHFRKCQSTASDALAKLALLSEFASALKRWRELTDEQREVSHGLLDNARQMVAYRLLLALAPAK